MNNLAIIRKRQRLTQAELAAEVGISTDHLQRLETHRRHISLPTAERLARALSLSVDQLLDALRTDPICDECGGAVPDCRCRAKRAEARQQSKASLQPTVDAGADRPGRFRSSDWVD